MGSRVFVSQVVSEQLKESFRRKYGGSKAKLLRALNQQFQADVEGDDKETKNVVSLRTLSGFFNNKGTPGKRDEETLNYLCIHLLECESYLDAVESLPNESQAQQSYEAQTIGSSQSPAQPETVKLPVEDYSELVERHFQRNEEIYGYVKPPLADAPMLVRDIYISPYCSRQQRKKQSKKRQEILQQVGPPAPLEREEGMSGEEAIANTRRIIMWGRLGSGKTTFLKNAAARRTGQLPIFISLKQWSEDETRPELLEAIRTEFAGGTAELNVVIDMLRQGRMRVLLDGLDEVTYDENGLRIQSEINRFAQTYHNASIIITSRIGQYSYHFPLFAEAEISDLPREEITTFVTTWFKNCGQPDVGKRLIHKLDKDYSLRSFANTFMQLSMLCVSMQGGYGVPENKFSLYENAIKVMLDRRDAKRGIERDKVAFSKQRKINFLCQIAYEAFLEPEIKYEWKVNELHQQLRIFGETVATIRPQHIEDDIEAVLNALESHHGILVHQTVQGYTFASVALQEYFVALYIVESRDRQVLETTIQRSLTDPRWRSVFVMIAERLQNADEFLQLLQAYIDSLVRKTPKIREVLQWLDRLTASCNVSTSSWRAGCLCVDLEIDFFVSRYSIDEESREQARMLAQSLYEMNKDFGELKPMTDDYEVRLQIAAIHSLAQDSIRNIQPESGNPAQKRLFEKLSPFTEEYTGLNANADISVELDKAVDIAERLCNRDKFEAAGEDAQKAKNHMAFLEKLRGLQNTFPSYQAQNASDLIQWTEDLRNMGMKHLNICHNIELTNSEAKAFKDYLYVNNILLECIQLDSVASRSLRQSIRSNILLPA